MSNKNHIYAGSNDKVYQKKYTVKEDSIILNYYPQLSEFLYVGNLNDRQLALELTFFLLDSGEKNDTRIVIFNNMENLVGTKQINIL